MSKTLDIPVLICHNEKCKNFLTYKNITILLGGKGMPIGAMIFLGIILFIFAVLDIFMLVSLLKPGDERNQIIIWKASSFTLSTVVGAMVLDVIENFVRAQNMNSNPLIQLEVAAIIYFIALMYYRKRYGG